MCYKISSFYRKVINILDLVVSLKKYNFLIFIIIANNRAANVLSYSENVKLQQICDYVTESSYIDNFKVTVPAL